jgi:hypothetical protein
LSLACGVGIRIGSAQQAAFAVRSLGSCCKH